MPVGPSLPRRPPRPRGGLGGTGVGGAGNPVTGRHADRSCRRRFRVSPRLPAARNRRRVHTRGKNVPHWTSKTRQLGAISPARDPIARKPCALWMQPVPIPSSVPAIVTMCGLSIVFVSGGRYVGAAEDPIPIDARVRSGSPGRGEENTPAGYRPLHLPDSRKGSLNATNVPINSPTLPSLSSKSALLNPATRRGLPARSGTLESEPPQ